MKIKFAIPSGYQLPEGVEAGQTFDESATFKLEGDKLCLVMLNGVSMPGYEEKGKKAEPPSFASQYEAAMAANS